jgi:hypothetical protein
VRVERVALEDHGDVAVAGRHVVHDAFADQHQALGDLLEAGDHAQGGCLAGPGGADEHHELALGDLQVEPRDGTDAARIHLGDVLEADAGQGSLL